MLGNPCCNKEPLKQPETACSQGFEASNNFCLRFFCIPLNGGSLTGQMFCDLGSPSGYMKIVSKLMDTSKRIEAGYA